jgi:phosphate:Na+ symporter
MSKMPNKILRISVFVLLLCAGLCLAVGKSTAAESEIDTERYFSDEQVKIILEGIAQKNFNKAESLKTLYGIDSEKFTEDEIVRSLRWLEEKGAEGQEKAAELKDLWKEDRDKFGVRIKDLVEGELLEAATDQKREAIRDGIFGTLGGLGLFLFGMGLMSEGLKKAAGHKFKSLLEVLTKNRVVAVVTGALVTALIQSSSATTVMTVGLVNAGLLTLKQALCVVLGANIGTTITAGLVSVLALFKITNYALPAVGLGFLLMIGGRSHKARTAGEILVGFGVLFLGIHFMKDAFAPLRDSLAAQRVLIWVGQNPFLAVLAGTAITVLLQSSSASIALIQVLAWQGAFGANWDQVLSVTIPYILGDNIGTTITAQIAALRSSRNGKRAAMGHTVFNVIGVLYMLLPVWLGWYTNVVKWFTPGTLNENTIMTHIFAAHCTFNVFNTIVFLPAIRLLQTAVMKMIPVTQSEVARKPVALETHLLKTPAIALGQAKREIVRMSKAARKTLLLSIDGILDSNKHHLKTVREMEDYIDDFQLEITSYLSALSRQTLSDELSVELPVLLHAVNDLERIGDHAVNIVEIAERKVDQKLDFSSDARTEAEQLKVEIEEMFDHVVEALETDDREEAKQAHRHEAMLNRMQVNFRRSHVQRMSDGKCTPEAGLIFIDLVDNVEKTGDHLTNIAQAIIGGLQWEGVKPKISADS